MRLRNVKWSNIAAHTGLLLAGAVVGSLAGAAPAAAAAAEPQADTPPRRPHGPPPEAIAACDEAEAGDACSFELHDQTIEGTCRQGRSADPPLACMLNRPPPQPPKEALAACEGLSSGASCSVRHGDETLSGVCRTGPNGDEPLACVPERAPMD